MHARSVSRSMKYLPWLLLVIYAFVIIPIFYFHDSSYSKSKTVAYNNTVKLELVPLEKIDWHDEKFIDMENEREGNGEHGQPATLPPDRDKNKCDDEAVFKNMGYNACLSDYISVNRSMPECRPLDCRKVKYRRYLPDASVIVPVHNEHLSVLLRALHSIVNRAPVELLREVIVVDDGSTVAHMKEELDEYVASYLPKVRIFHIPPPRKGLMAARLLGARSAIGQVLVFLDSNIEANVNWLPPLLEPIAENYKTCVCPVVDVIDTRTFAINSIGQGVRNIFNWFLVWVSLPLLPEDLKNPVKPFKSPVMVGCAFAISSTFFWELGGYDPGLELWGGEQFELAFKIWLCGGALLDAPCSRVAHLYRANGQPFRNPDGVGDYISKNLKRVAAVWMDEYAEYVYLKKGSYFRNIDPGDLSKQHELRQRLNCKPFKWFMEKIAFDIVGRYPLIEPPDYGSGRITPVANERLCLTLVKTDKSVELKNCSNRLHQEFVLRWRKDIQERNGDLCLDVSKSGSRVSVDLYKCHGGLGNQLWRYNLETQQFIQGFSGRCLDHDAETRMVYAQNCDEKSRTQKWLVEKLDEETLKKWNVTIPLVA